MAAMRCLLRVLPLALLACQSERGLHDRTWSDTWQQAPNNEVDILFVVDDSESMAVEQDTLARGFTTFVGEIERTGTAFQLGVITTSFDYDDPDRGKLIGDPPVITPEDDYVALFEERVRVGLDGSDKEKGLEAAVHALSPSLATGANSGFLRWDAHLLLVFVSDEDDCSDRGALNPYGAEACYDRTTRLVPVEDLAAELRALKETPDKVQIGAIVGPVPETGQTTCADALPGRRYAGAARLTGGLAGDICTSNWSNMLNALGVKAAGIQSAFQTRYAAETQTLEVRVDGVPQRQDPEDGWTYDEETWYLHFHGDAVPDRGSEIRASYTIRPGTGSEPTTGGAVRRAAGEPPAG